MNEIGASAAYDVQLAQGEAEPKGTEPMTKDESLRGRLRQCPRGMEVGRTGRGQSRSNGGMKKATSGHIEVL